MSHTISNSIKDVRHECLNLNITRDVNSVFSHLHFLTHGLVVIGALQVYASDAYTLPGNTAVLPCLVMVPVEQAWAVQVTHWTVSSSPNNQHLVDSHAIPQREYFFKKRKGEHFLLYEPFWLIIPVTNLLDPFQQFIFYFIFQQRVCHFLISYLESFIFLHIGGILSTVDLVLFGEKQGCVHLKCETVRLLP